jgi:hypothetical protein
MSNAFSYPLVCQKVTQFLFDQLNQQDAKAPRTLGTYRGEDPYGHAPRTLLLAKHLG